MSLWYENLNDQSIALKKRHCSVTLSRLHQRQQETDSQLCQVDRLFGCLFTIRCAQMQEEDMLLGSTRQGCRMFMQQKPFVRCCVQVSSVPWTRLLGLRFGMPASQISCKDIGIWWNMYIYIYILFAYPQRNPFRASSQRLIRMWHPPIIKMKINNGKTFC